ncbi:MAG: hypothetical protein SV062_01990, partial [Thermodesulfobacteriota bacterium]|nr:hypothetical protein [Thermodesulfobacteriota bacterium]
MVKGLKISTLCFFILLLSVILSKVSFTKTLKLITVVKSREISSYGTALKGFEDKLKEGGLKFLTYEYNLQENLKVEEIIKGIKLRKSDLILTFGSSATQIVKVVK